ncbi:hypothetical protein IWQ56_003561, partial [Coemansia nantahalensis]
GRRARVLRVQEAGPPGAQLLDGAGRNVLPLRPGRAQGQVLHQPPIGGPPRRQRRHRRTQVLQLPGAGPPGPRLPRGRARQAQRPRVLRVRGVWPPGPRLLDGRGARVLQLRRVRPPGKGLPRQRLL